MNRSLPLPDDPRELGMQPHPEGGWYRETWRHADSIETPRGPRALATSVAFLLRRGERSAWHRVASEELWIWAGGGQVRLTLGGHGDRPDAGDPTVLGPADHVLVPAGHWQRAEPVDEAALVACIVSPGFDFADFTLLEAGAGS